MLDRVSSAAACSRIPASTGTVGRAGRARAVHATASARTSRSTWIFTGSILLLVGLLLFLVLSKREKSSRHRVGGFWGYPAPQQVSGAWDVHSGCVCPVGRGAGRCGYPADTRRMPRDYPPVSRSFPPATSVCPHIYPQPVCADFALSRWYGNLHHAFTRTTPA